MEDDDTAVSSSILAWSDDELKVLSPVQIEICQMKVDKKSCQEIIQKFRLKSSSNISTCIRSTIQGNIWSPGESFGGRPSYLSDVDIMYFKRKINESAVNLDCINTKEALQLALELKDLRFRSACAMVSSIKQKCPIPKSYLRTLKTMEPYIPSVSWLSSFCSNNGIILKDPETLENARKNYCNRKVINDFLTQNFQILHTIKPQLLFNADETTSITTKKFKALTLEKTNLSSITVEKNEPHISSLLCYNAAGFKLKPFIVLPKKKRFPEELATMDCFLASQTAGWMTRQLFSAFAVFFVASISLYRLELPPDLRSQTIVLLVDNHISRCNSYAAELFHLHNIKLITFPAHCTHVLQPFDVGVASTFKLNLSSFKISKPVLEKSKKLNKEAARIRYLIISSIVNSWNSIPTEILEKSFYSSGILPWNPEIPKNNSKTNQISTLSGPVRPGKINIANKDLTTDDNRLALFNGEYKTQFTNVGQLPKPAYSKIYSVMAYPNSANGFILSKFPSLLVKQDDGNYKDLLS